VEASTLTDRVYENLKQRILRREFPCGERLNIAALAEDLNVSNTPVREAISRLEKVGLVKIVPYRGPFVRSLSLSEATEVYDVRISLEVLASRLAALHATPDTLSVIELRTVEFEEARRGNNLEETLRADLQFHEAVARASENRTLIDMLGMLSDWTYLFLQYSLFPARPTPASGASHTDILEAIRSGDSEVAGATMRRHLVAGKAMLLEQLSSDDTETHGHEQKTYTNVWRELAEEFPKQEFMG
jgi:DNA-binding GntR family transcriptional regulator